MTVDAAHAVLSDGVARAFGPRWFEWVTEALTGEGRDPEDLSVLLTDDLLAERVLQQVRERMRADDEAPDLPDMDFGWYAYGPTTRPVPGKGFGGRRGVGLPTPAWRCWLQRGAAWPAGARSARAARAAARRRAPSLLADGLLDHQ